VKKLITALASILLVSSPLLAKDLKVGDLMPDYKKGMYSSRKDELIEGECFNWVYNYFERDSVGNKIERFLAAFSYWDKRPFLIYDFKENIIYIDNQNNKKRDTDGKIDRIQKLDEESFVTNISNYNPTCKLKDFEEVMELALKK